MMERYGHWLLIAVITAALYAHLIVRYRERKRRRELPVYRIEFYDDMGYLPEVMTPSGWRFIERDGKTTRPLNLWNDPLFRGEFHSDLSGARTCVAAHKGLAVVPPLVVWTSEE